MLPTFAILTVCSAAVSGVSEKPVDFVREVRPILSHHCFACHGPDESSRKARLNLSESETAARVIVPGDLEASELWLRVTSEDDPMPPPEEHNELSVEQIDVLRRWIEAGASFAPHWAYVDPQPCNPPAVTADDSVDSVDSVDTLIHHRLQEQELEPAPVADPETLLRRLTYDLIGLPPTLSELEAFLRGQETWEQAIDRLLASPHYGERMAMFWLDLVRYADTVGYHGDQDHRVWPYRDYVIAAFNRNLPFDQFTIEQLAGDLLPAPTQEQLVATAYNRLLQTSHEGGVQLGEYREIYLADRVRNVSSVWLGGTLGCAQCHDHKYDPYTARDFYAMGAFFADVDDEEHLRNPYNGLNTLPTPRLPEMVVKSEDAKKLGEEIKARVTEAEKSLQTALAGLPERRSVWMDQLRAKVQSNSAVETTWVDDRLDTGGDVEGNWTFQSPPNVEPHSGSAYRTQTHDAQVQHYSVNTNRTFDGGAGRQFFAWVFLDADNPPKSLMLQFSLPTRDWGHRAVWGGDEINYGRQDESWPGYRRMGPLPEVGQWVRLMVDLDVVGVGEGQIVNGVAFTQYGGTVHWDRCGWTTVGAPQTVIAALQAEVPDEEAQRILVDHHEQTDEAVILAKEQLANRKAEAEQFENSLPKTLYTRALAEPREVRIRPRGNWLDDSGDIVQPAVPKFLGVLQVDGRATRLDLAQWLVSDEGYGGKTARVLVNRLWAMLFGVGLCPSVEDFGGQGRPPNHPQLLDHLTLEFIDSGWDVKGLIRRLVTTRSYRQSSVPSVLAAEVDPFNELFARQARHRLSAEMVRDMTLAVSGLLVRDVGGPSVKPPQPEGYFRHLNFPTRRYHEDADSARWRRGVYVHWQRQYLHPMLRAFDAPTREECVARRAVSNTPTAALTLLNDPALVEAARAFAVRILQRDLTDRERVALAWREVTSRPPNPEEVKVVLELLHSNESYYREHPEEALDLLSVGMALPDEEDASATNPATNQTLVASQAAWTQVARALLNLHEAINRD